MQIGVHESGKAKVGWVPANTRGADEEGKKTFHRKVSSVPVMGCIYYVATFVTESSSCYGFFDFALRLLGSSGIKHRKVLFTDSESGKYA